MNYVTWIVLGSVTAIGILSVWHQMSGWPATVNGSRDATPPRGASAIGEDLSGQSLAIGAASLDVAE